MNRGAISPNVQVPLPQTKLAAQDLTQHVGVSRPSGHPFSQYHFGSPNNSVLQPTVSLKQTMQLAEGRCCELSDPLARKFYTCEDKRHQIASSEQPSLNSKAGDAYFTESLNSNRKKHPTWAPVSSAYFSQFFNFIYINYLKSRN